MITPGQFNVGPTGAFTYTVPIAAPPGTGGMVPSISLDYSSQGGDGLVGLGWTISGLPSVTRCARTYAQDGVHGSVNFDSNDKFCLEGQRLVQIGTSAALCNNGTTGTEYRSEVDGFSRIISCGTMAAGGPIYFKVWTKSGQVMDFGSSSFQVKPVKPDGSGVLMQAIRIWPVNKIADTVGNYLTVAYDGGTADNVNGQVYPTEIDYTANGSHQAYNSVRLSYDLVTTGTPAYQAGAAVLITHVLTEIDTCTNVAPTNCTSPVSRYYLYYNGTLPGNGNVYVTQGDQHNELTEVQHCDSSGNCLAPTKFTWQGSRDVLTLSNPTSNGDAQGYDIFPGSFAGSGSTDMLTDGGGTKCGAYFGSPSGALSKSSMTATYMYWEKELNDNPPPDYNFVNYQITNGAPCFAIMNGGNAYARRRFPDYDGDGYSDAILNQQTSDAGASLFILHNEGGADFNQVNTFSAGYTILADFDGDGRTDIFTLNGSTQQAQFSNGDGTFGGIGRTGLSLGTGPIMSIGDFDGDGCADVMQQGSANNVQLSCSPATPSFNVTNWTGSAITFGDFNGDGKTDVLVANPSSGSTTLYLSTGKAFIQQTGCTLPTDWWKYAIYPGDFNSDGKTDLLLVASGASGGYGVGTTHKIYLSTGTCFVVGKNASGGNVTIANSTSGDTTVTASVADWNNDGVSDIWIQKPSGDARSLFTYTPEVIQIVDNGIGSTTTATYDRINQNGSLFTKGSDPAGCTGAAPTTCTQNIDGPLYVVKQITSSNGIGGTYSSTYGYAGAKVDLLGRGLLGFASVAITDSQTHVVQTTTYHTDFPYIGIVASQTKVCLASYCNASQVTLSSTTNGYDNVRSGTANNYYYAVRLRTSVSQSNDIDASLTVLPIVETDYDNYDSYGNARTVTVKTTHPGESSPDLTKVTTNTFDNDATNWFLGRIRTAYVTTAYSPTGGSPSTITRQSSFTYDASSGLLNEEVVEPNAANTSNLKITTDYGYDGYGNKTSATVTGSGSPAPPACQTTTTYDTSHGQFPVKVTNCLTQSETWGTVASPGYDARFGMPTLHTGPNGLSTTWSYDGFGRKSQEIRPDLTFTTVSYIYCNHVNGGTDTSCPTNGAFYVKVTTSGTDSSQIAPTTRAYYDALSRPLSADVQGFDGSWIRTDTLYDSSGRVSKTSRPYFLVGGTPVYATVTYDQIGRAIKILQPDGGYTSTAFAGLTTTTTVHLVRPDGTTQNQATITVKNDLGQVASVQDAASNTTSYTYDAVGDLTTTTDPLLDVVQNWFDVRGRKTKSKDPDMGTWTYVYDSLGRLVSQTDAIGQITTIGFDVLGRMTSRVEPDMSSTWTYDTAANGIGKLAEADCAAGATGNACPSGNYSRVYTYDSHSRQSKVTITVNGSSYHSDQTYDPTSGKLATERTFSGYTTANVYNGTGYQTKVKDNSTGFVLWQAQTRDAELHLLTSLAGNGVTTTANFDTSSGRVETISAGLSADATHEVANLGFDWGTNGSLYDRTDTHMSGWQQETFCYDTLNRLTNSSAGTSCTAAGTMKVVVGYDALGDITSKTHVGTYSYPTPGAGSDQPHAVSSIATSGSDTVNGVANPTFTYDNNGNMRHGAGRDVTYTSFNLAASVTSGANALALTYDPEHQRVQQCTPDCTNPTTTTTYLNDSVGGAMTERVTSGSGGQTINYRTYIVADGKLVAERFVTGGVASLRYFVLDHLGSVSVITDESGLVLSNGRLSYDPWGSMRNLDGSRDTTCSLPPQSSTTRGFTSQEEMPNVCLINYNARIYDPQIGRFMAADPTIEAPYNPQDLNRFSYVGNNPLSFTDPSGLCFLGCFWKNPIFVAILAVAIAIFVPYALAGFSFGVFTAGTLAAIGDVALGGALAGAVSAGLTGGNILTGALFGGIQAAAMAGLVPILGGDLAGPLSILGKNALTAGRLIAAGMVGGLMSSAQGGNFLSGFLAGGVGSLGGAILGEPTGTISPQGIFVSAALGGASAVLGGGKFENGAITGAFAYVAMGLAASRPEDPVAFVGGACDQTCSTESNNVYKQYIKFSTDNPDVKTAYFSATDSDGLTNWLNGINADDPVTVITQSLGVKAAYYAALAVPGRIDILITIDPVLGLGGTSVYSALQQNVGEWIDVYAHPSDGLGLADYIAMAGGQWGLGPQGYTSALLPVDLHHADFIGAINALSVSPVQVPWSRW